MGEAVMIPVSQGQFALVDQEDAHRVRNVRWQLKRGKAGRFYARTGRGGNSCYLHQLIVQYGRGFLVDHINGDGLDNRKRNLRICTIRENNLHRQPETARTGRSFKGMYWCRLNEKYRVDIETDGKRRFIGLFENQIEAAKAYDEAALKYHGEFAWLNFPKGGVS